MKLPQQVARILESAISFDGTIVRITRQLDRKDYIEVNKVLEAFGGKWNRKAGGHVFSYEPESVIIDSIATGEYLDPKSDLNFFPTPPELAGHIVNLAGVERGDRVLEPSAGTGNILRELSLKTRNLLFCEIDDGMRLQLLHEQSEQYIRRWGLLCPDFLEVPNILNLAPIDIIVANPPFSRGRDVLHVSTMLDVARTRVVSVMSAGFTFRSDKKTQALKEKLTKGWNWEISDLPEDSFKSSGTRVSTVLLVAERKGVL